MSSWFGTQKRAIPVVNMYCADCHRKWFSDKPKGGEKCPFCDSKNTEKVG